MNSGTSLKMIHVRTKTTSLDQILGKPCVRFRGHIFSPIFMKPGQNGCLDETSKEFENGSCLVKNQVTRSNLRKTLCTLQRPHFQSDYHETLSEYLF